MKRQAWAIAVLAVMAAGCSVSDRASDSGNAAGTPSEKWGVLTRPADVSEPSVDEEFDLLEKEFAGQTDEVPDPLEPVNRLMFGVNDTLYFWVVRPVTQTYRNVVPRPARTGIRNFFQNVGTPVRLVNCLLQGKGDGAGVELRRFVINTTEGILGFGEPAQDKHGLYPVAEDLGQTLATYGFGDGFYIVWPLFGPSTARDSLGMVGDWFLDPAHYLDPRETRIGVAAAKGVNEGSFHVGEYEEFKAAALEPYVAMREAYIQYRENKIRQ